MSIKYTLLLPWNKQETQVSPFNPPPIGQTRKCAQWNKRPRSPLNILNTFHPKILGHTQLKFLTELIHSKDIVDIARKSSDFSFRLFQTLITREALKQNSSFYIKSVPPLSFSTCLPYALLTHYFSLSKEKLDVTEPPSSPSPPLSAPPPLLPKVEIHDSMCNLIKCQKKKGKK